MNVSIVTGTRAEYGLLRPVLRRLFADETLQTRLLATGSHLSAQYGNTAAEIEADGFPIGAKLDILSAAVPPGREGTARRTALALDLFLRELTENRPDVLLVLGDRYEIFAAAQAAALLDIPVAHISGGEVTKGADDDWFRHCISKMAKLHFPSCQLHRQRLLRMGEEPRRVFNVGGLGDENIRHMKLLSRPALADNLHLPLEKPFALVTFHPETASAIPVAAQADALLGAIEKHLGLFYLFTAANADAGGEEMNRRFMAFCENHENAVLVASLGSLRYLSAMRYASLVLGNSSSGVVETPSFGTPTVNIGQRQTGRLICQNVKEAPMDAAAIAAAMAQALSPAFAAAAKGVQSPYNGGDTSGHIHRLLKEALASGILKETKTFYDGPDDL